MKVSILSKVLHHDKLGSLRQGAVVDLPEKQAEALLARGFVELHETKVMRERPSEAAGEQQSASPVAPVSTEQTPKPSKRGGRPKKVVE